MNIPVKTSDNSDNTDNNIENIPAAPIPSATPNIKPFSEAVRFHGHTCPGLAIGYLVAVRAMKELCSGRSEDEELVAIVENDSCSIDAIQVVTGCTIGKGNLIFSDHGKQAYTIINRTIKKAMRISLKPEFNTDNLDPELATLREKAFSEEATKQDKKVFGKHMEEVVSTMMKIPDDEILNVREAGLEIPEKARIFKSVRCAGCGEMVSESRARVRNGKIVCIPCFDAYSRGW